MRPEPLRVHAVLVDDLVHLKGAPVVNLGQDLVLLPQRKLQLRAKDPGIEQVLDADAGPGDLVAVGRAYPAAGGPDPRLTEITFGNFIERSVMRHDQMRVRADQQLGDVDAAGAQPVHLLEQDTGIHDHTIADHRHAVRAQHAAGDQVQGIAFRTDDNGMSGIVTPLIPDDEVDRPAEQVGRLSFALIAPLGADQHERRHRVRLPGPPDSGMSHRRRNTARSSERSLRTPAHRRHQTPVRTDHPSGSPLALLRVTVESVFR